MALILFVDDDPLTLETMARAAHVLGHQAVAAENGEQALERIEQQVFDMIFVDIRLPDINGYDLVKKIVARVPSALTPTLVLSAEPDFKAAQLAQAAGARAYIAKPIRLDDLDALIKQYTGQ